MQPYAQLERDFGAYMRVLHTVACASGTAALHLALESLELPKGSRVIVPEFTMVACARAVVMAGLVPVFVDCTDDMLLDVSKLDEVLTEDTVAVMPVHIYGRRCPMDAIHDWAWQNSVLVVEDLAELHGIPPHRNTAAAAWSMYRNKVIAGEEGGMIAFQEPAAADRARSLRSLGFTEQHDFTHLPRGINARMSNAHASLILQSLAAVSENLHKRATVASWYDDLLPAVWHLPARESTWVYDLRIPSMQTPLQDTIVQGLLSQGIAARRAFRPMSSQPEFRGAYRHLNAYRLSQEVIYLPVTPEMTFQDVHRIVQALLPLADPAVFN